MFIKWMIITINFVSVMVKLDLLSYQYKESTNSIINRNMRNTLDVIDNFSLSCAFVLKIDKHKHYTVLAMAFVLHLRFP